MKKLSVRKESVISEVLCTMPGWFYLKISIEKYLSLKPVCFIHQLENQKGLML